MAEQQVEWVTIPEEALTPREIRLDRAAVVLRWGALINAALVVLLLIGSLLSGLQTISSIFTPLHAALLGGFGGADDAAVAIVILLLLVNISLLLVMMVGVLAREIWVLPALIVIIVANIAGVIIFGFTPALITIATTLVSAYVFSSDLRAFRVNPVMIKELRGRMRGVRAFIVLTVYLGLMSGFTALMYLILIAQNQASGSSSAGSIGRVLFIGLVGIELLLIIFIAPAFTAGAITGERERQTYDLLRTTLLASPSFVIGKLESALSYIVLLLFSAIPLQSIAFLFGGVSEAELVLSFVILAVTAITLGTVGIFFSAITPRTLSASVRSYTVALAVAFGVPILINFPLLNAFVNAVSGFGTGVSSSPVIEAIMVYVGLILVSLNPITAALVTQQLLTERQVAGFWVLTLSSDGSTIPVVSPWISFTILYLVIATVLVVLAVRRMRRVEA